jgi:hypothetical protein
MTSIIWDNLNRLSDEEIYEKVKGGHYTEEFNTVAIEILKQRGLSVPEVKEGYVKQKIPFRKSHPIWFWTFTGAIISALVRWINQLIRT